MQTQKNTSEKKQRRRRRSAVDVQETLKQPRPTKPRRTAEQRIEDLDKLRRLMAKGLTQQQMADVLGVDRTTVSRTITALESEWQAGAVEALAVQRGRAANRLLHVQAEAWAAWEASKQMQRKVSTAKGTQNDKDVDLVKTETTAQGALVVDGEIVKEEGKPKSGLPGDPRFLKIIVDAEAQLAALYGLNAPVKVAPTNPEGDESYTPYSIDDFAPLIAQAREYEQKAQAQAEFQAALMGGAHDADRHGSS